MAPDLAQFERQYASQVNVIEINVDETGSDVYRKYEAMKSSNYIPETAVLKDGKVVKSQVGTMSVSDLAQFMKLGQ